MNENAPTDEEKETIQRLWANGKSSSQIASFINMERGNRGVLTRNAVIGVIHRARAKGTDMRMTPHGERHIIAKAKRKRRIKPERPYKVHDKKDDPIPEASDGELVTPDAAMVDRVHLFRAIGQRDIPFMERKIGECAWPVWDNSQKSGPVCGAETPEGMSYCSYHQGVGTTGHRASQPYRVR